MKQRGGSSGRMSYREAVELMQDQGGVLMHAGGQMHVQDAGAEAEGAGAEAEAPEYRRCRCAGVCDEEAMPGEDVCERCYTIEGCCDLEFPDEPDSESHTESSPQLGDREGKCEHHSGHGSHGCRAELEGSEVVCDLCGELDAFGRCDCDCDQCIEGNNWVTNVMEAFSMVEQREMTPQDWVRLSKEEKAAYSEFKEDADREAAQTEELPEADDGRAISFMAEERLSEVQMPGVR